MKRFLSMILVLTMVFSFVTITGASADDRTEIKIAWYTLNPKDTMDPVTGLVFKGSYALAELLEKKIPEAKITFIPIPADNWMQKMETVLVSGDADIGWFTNQAQIPNWLVDLREMMANDSEFTEETFEKTFTKAAVHYARYHTFTYPEHTGAIYGLPYDASSHYLMYDKVLFEQWGVEVPKQDATFAELLELAQKMTGINPVTGKQNYGCYILPRWTEWLGVGADLYHSISVPGMDINQFDMEKDVEYIKDSQAILDYFQLISDFLKCSPPGAPSGTGFENWMTPDNDIAIMLAAERTTEYYHYVMANETSVTDRFIPIFLPKGELGMSGFPEFHNIGIAQTSEHKDLAWKIVKTCCTDKEVLNFIFENYSAGAVPALADPTGLDIMNDPFTKARYEDRVTSTYITDDYWYWRDTIRGIFSEFFAGTLTPEEARQKFYDGVVKWIGDKQKQLGT